MSDTRPGSPPAGWYPDPAGSDRTRWWDGARWTENFSAAPASASTTPTARPDALSTPSSPTPAPPWSTGSAATPYPNAVPYGAAPEPLTAPAGTSPYTPFIWVLALLPLASTVSTIIQLGSIDRAIDAAADAAANPAAAPSLDFTGSLVSLVLFGAAMLLIVLDWRALNRAAVPRPFHWAWGFFMIVGAPVYMIGRSIVVRRRTGAGLAPMFVNLALLVINAGIGITIFVITFSAVLENTPLP